MIFPTQKTYWQFVAMFVAIELCSWLAYSGPRSEQIVTILILIGAVLLAIRKPHWLVYASIAEVIVGSKGYLFFLTIGGTAVSIRMIMFVILSLSSVRQIYLNWKNLRQQTLVTPLVFFVAWLAVAVLVGLLRQNNLSTIYTDMNAFFYLGLLPVWWVRLRTQLNWRVTVIALLLAGATVIGLKSWLIVLLFGQSEMNVAQVYRWIRNTGVGEITYIHSNVFRVFFQSQIYALLTFCLLLVHFLRNRVSAWHFIPFALSALGVYISLSRSLWLGLAAALTVSCIWLIAKHQSKRLIQLWLIIPVGIFSWAMLVWALSFPTFSLTAGQANTVVSRFQGNDSADAATARTNQIQPLFKSIANHPVIGSGFGTVVTYISTDPRTKGPKTTSAFELGYLDLWLKIGIVGLVLYAMWIIGLWRRLRGNPWAGPLIISGIALLTVHLTTPYLNHPLGLSWLMITSLFATVHE